MGIVAARGRSQGIQGSLCVALKLLIKAGIKDVCLMSGNASGGAQALHALFQLIAKSESNNLN
jgi:hypothetical protein